MAHRRRVAVRLDPRHGSQAFPSAAVPDRKWMRQYGCEQEGTKASSRRDPDAARDTRGRCTPRRPRPCARDVRVGRATGAHISRWSRRNRSDAPRSHVTPARIRSRARCSIPRREEFVVDRELKPLRVGRLARRSPRSHRDDRVLPSWTTAYGALMEQSGRNRWQPVANGMAAETAPTSANPCRGLPLVADRGAW